MSAPLIITEATDDTAPANDGIFSGLRFFLVQRLPSRSDFVNKIQANGGRIVKLEAQADHIIADHLRKEAPAGSVSYTFIDAAIRDGELPDLGSHSAGGARRAGGTVRAVASSAPARSTRTPFTADDDSLLWEWVETAKDQGISIKGNEIYKQLEAINPRHTFHSWRDRYLKKVIDFAPPQRRRQLPGNARPSARSSAAETNAVLSTQPRAAQSADPRRDRVDERKQRPTAKNNDTRKINTEEAQGDDQHSDEPPRNPFEEMLVNARDLEAIEQDQLGPAFDMWASAHPQHNAPTWRRFYDEAVRPAYLAHLSGDPAFTLAQFKTLMANAWDIENLDQERLDEAWHAWADVFPEHQGSEWREYYEETVKDVYLAAQPITEELFGKDEAEGDANPEKRNAAAKDTEAESRPQIELQHQSQPEPETELEPESAPGWQPAPGRQPAPEREPAPRRQFAPEGQLAPQRGLALEREAKAGLEHEAESERQPKPEPTRLRELQTPRGFSATQPASTVQKRAIDVTPSLDNKRRRIDSESRQLPASQPTKSAEVSRPQAISTQRSPAVIDLGSDDTDDKPKRRHRVNAMALDGAADGAEELTEGRMEEEDVVEIDKVNGINGFNASEEDRASGSLLTEENLASQQAQHRAPPLKAVDLDEDDSTKSQSEFIKTLQSMIPTAQLNPEQHPLLSRRAQEVLQKQEEEANAEDDDDRQTSSSGDGAEPDDIVTQIVSAATRGAPPDQLEINLQQLENQFEHDRLPIASQEEIDEAFDAVIQWPRSPSKGAPQADEDQDEAELMPTDTQVAYPDLGLGVRQSDEERRLDSVDAAQSGSLVDGAPVLISSVLSANAAEKPQRAVRIAVNDDDVDELDGDAEADSGDDDDKDYENDNDNELEDDFGDPGSLPSEIDFTVPEPKGGFVFSSSPIRKHKGDSSQRNPANLPEETAGRDNQRTSPSSASSSSSALFVRANGRTGPFKAQSYGRTLETQDILNAETQQPDFDIPLPPDSDHEQDELALTYRSSPPPPQKYRKRRLSDLSFTSIQSRDQQQATTYKDVEDFQAEMRYQGFAESSIGQALYCTSMDAELAHYVLLEERAGRGLSAAARGMPGVWTSDEDEAARNGNAPALKAVVNKHGDEGFQARLDFLWQWDRQ